MREGCYARPSWGILRGMSVGPVRMTFGVLLIAAGVLGFVVFLVTSLLKVFGGMQRVEAPGTRELVLEPGDYTIYWETDSRFTSVPSFSDLDLAVVSRSGETRPVSSSGLMTSRYSTMDSVGVSVAAFSVERPGPYGIKAAAAAGKALPKGRIVVSPSMGFLGVLKLVVLCIAILGAGVGSGLTVLLRRSSVPGP
jgi:hypothetical protein